MPILQSDQGDGIMRSERRIGLSLSRATKSGAAILGFLAVAIIAAQSVDTVWAGIAGVAGAVFGWNAVGWFRAWRQTDEWH